MTKPDAIVFDFDGVLADTEPLHFRTFAETLASRGVELTSRAYYERYLGFDDHAAFWAIERDERRGWSDEEILRLMTEKAAAFRRLATTERVLFAGVAQRLEAFAAEVPLAIASGAFRVEIETVLAGAEVDRLFPVIVAAGETARGKPSPDPYARALALLGETVRISAGGVRGGPGGAAIDPSRSVAVEDSTWGIDSARAAGMKVVAITTSYPAERLRDADLVVSAFQELTLARMADLIF